MNISVIRRLDESDGAMSALQFVLNPSDTQTSTDEIRSSLREKLLGAKCVQSGCVDCAVQVDDIARLCRRLVVFDMDSTLVEGEVIDELAKLAGVEKEVSAITSKAMHGEIDFFESLKQRVALLKGASAKYLIDEVESRMKFTPGARQLTKTLKAMGFKMAVISGGFLPFAQHTKKELGLDYAYANELEIDSNGLLCGRTVGPVVTPQRKRNLLVMLARVEGVRVDQAIAVGDGANDIPMLTTAGLGVAFCAKPKVQEQANFRVNNKDLSTILYLVGLTQADIGKAEDA
ncbi:Phosphoserine phosphatase, putative [Perkinsus marinus ATCC 50983]|nr:Phosphoserine phosphatase, putative [Perkinsus marinus ATCC 50983]EER13235.1 Phosphoserine phosphatase, putative [Perkinsus marinus ATCC 50983]|eukprot:XP_002781440.1 Phosphoserine phosphatase, putative [Perkinsus marinus ATCC 50983]